MEPQTFSCPFHLQTSHCSYIQHELDVALAITKLTALVMVKLMCTCRYEGQMQSQRLRMVSDNELRLEQFQAERKDEKRRYEDALDRLKQVCSSHAFNPNPL